MLANQRKQVIHFYPPFLPQNMLVEEERRKLPAVSSCDLPQPMGRPLFNQGLPRKEVWAPKGPIQRSGPITGNPLYTHSGSKTHSQDNPRTEHQHHFKEYIRVLQITFIEIFIYSHNTFQYRNT